MSKEELIVALKECAENSDTEIAHEVADKLLIIYINDQDIKEAFESIKKWYS